MKHLANCEAMQIDAKVVNLETQFARKQQSGRSSGGIPMVFITVEKFRVCTHHNALRFISVSHITVQLAQARPNE